MGLELTEVNYVLPEIKDNVWITVNNISIYIKRTDEGVVIDLYPLGKEIGEPLTSTWLLFSEAEED